MKTSGVINFILQFPIFISFNTLQNKIHYYVKKKICYTIEMEPIKPEEKTRAQLFWELVRFALVALIIVVPIRVFVAEPFIVSGSSMVPTFENGDYLIIDKISYELGDPQRDDVVIFRYPGDPTKFFIKRIIGLPNETVDI